MSEKVAPPPVLHCARLLYYAVLDSSVEFTGRSLLFVDGKELGPVPCLAICEGEAETLLFHCSSDWSVLGLAVSPSSIAFVLVNERPWLPQRTRF
jgi:hypothetical protein